MHVKCHMRCDKSRIFSNGPYVFLITYLALDIANWIFKILSSIKHEVLSAKCDVCSDECRVLISEHQGTTLRYQVLCIEYKMLNNADSVVNVKCYILCVEYLVFILLVIELVNSKCQVLGVKH